MTHVMRKAEVEKVLGVSSDTINRMVAAGEFPKPIRLSVRAIGWLRSDLDAWIEARAAKRDTQRAVA